MASRLESIDPDAIDLDQPLEVANRVWWVGSHLPDDPFQCHTYLLENGNESILFDPGSKLTFSKSLRKIEQIVPFGRIRYFVCHHQDPDITGALPLIDQLVTREDAVIVSHWRAIALLKHSGLRLPFICVEKQGWQLLVKERLLRSPWHSLGRP